MKNIIFLFFVLLVSCGAIDNYRIRKEVLDSKLTTPATKKLIEQGKIKIGMTKDEVIASWGLPCYHCYGTRSTSSGDWWEYNSFGTSRYGTGSGTHLRFNSAGILVYWSK